MTEQSPLQVAVHEVERHLAQLGWDQPARLFALVENRHLVRRQPDLAQTIGISAESPADGFTPIEQEQLQPDEHLEDLLDQIMWPSTVDGCVASMERLVLPPEVELLVPDDPEEAAAFAATHPLRQEVRIVAGAARGGASYCVLRLRHHDAPESLVAGDDLVPGLLELVRTTLDEEPT